MYRPRKNPQIALKPQDLVVLLRLSLASKAMPTYASLGTDLALTASEVHAALERAHAARLVRKDRSHPPVLLREPFLQFLLHGAPYAFPAVRGEATRGVPTAYAAAPLRDRIAQPTAEPPPVWPDPKGPVRGVALYPLYPSVPKAAAKSAALHELLALFDALRAGAARERKLAARELSARLSRKEGAVPGALRPAAAALPQPQAGYGGGKRSGKLRIPRRRLAELCRKYHVKKLSLFGSAARNEMTPESDVDLMVEFEPGRAPSLWDAPGAEQEFSALFGNRRVDIAPPEILRNPYRRKAILPDLKVLYEA